MAVNFIARKCACGGKLEFDPDKKIWVCKYCGTVVEREATFDRVQVDGIEGINDVVRQTLLDIANGNMENANRNLEDCERKNHKHVGTLIANISFSLANISFARTQDEARGSLDKVKIMARRLQSEFPVIAEEEINLYESFGDNASDIYANLIVVFDTLNDKSRVEYISSRLRPEEVFSGNANLNLLKISIKQKKYDVVEKIVGNENHIDKADVLKEIMDDYPDDDKKKDFIEKLLNQNVACVLSDKYFQDYFNKSQDSILTKNTVIRKLADTQIRCNAEDVVKALYAQMTEYAVAKETFLALYETKVSDQETEAILAFCLAVNQSFDVLTAYLDALLEKQVFVALKAGTVITFLDSSDLDADKKITVLEKLFRFEIDGKALDTVYNYYLNNNQDTSETRVKIIGYLLKDAGSISTGTVSTYVVKTSIDGKEKINIVKQILETGINRTYLGDLLSDYLLDSTDEPSVKDIISAFLMESGFKMDSNALNQYIAVSEEEPDVKLSKIKKLISNGTPVRADCLDSYILSLKKPEDFSCEILKVLSGYRFVTGFQAYARYLLECQDIDKAGNSTKMINSMTCDLRLQNITVSHLDNEVSCNLLQAYVLCSKDRYDTAKVITEDFIRMKMKLNTEIIVNGMTMKFKKYVAGKKAELAPLTLQLCEENKMFSLF